MVFKLGAGRDGDLVFNPGDIVQAWTPNREGSSWRGDPLMKAERRHRKESPNTRLGFFKAEGVVRYATALVDLQPSEKAPTIPVEATK